MRIAVYPGTFDPVTKGHLDILCRASKLFDKVIIAVAPNELKHPLFSLEERLQLIRENISSFENVSVDVFTGLTVDFAKQVGAVALIRGLRVVSDFEFEFQLSQMNRHLSHEIETIFLMPSNLYFYTSSTMIKQVAEYDAGRIKDFVPPNVEAALQRIFKQKK